MRVGVGPTIEPVVLPRPRFFEPEDDILTGRSEMPFHRELIGKIFGRGADLVGQRIEERLTRPRQPGSVGGTSGGGFQTFRDILERFGDPTNLATTGCGFGQKRNPRTGECEFFLGTQPGPDRGREAPGEAVMGQWGAALMPQVVGTVERNDGSQGPLLRCLRGMVLGTDSLCYNKPFANTKRKWPRGTRPFLTGGDVKCLRTTNRLRKSKSSKKLLRELGMG